MVTGVRAADDGVIFLQQQNTQTRPREIGGCDQTIVPGPEDDDA